MFNELKTELAFAMGYLNVNAEPESEGGKAAAEAISHALKLVELLKDRIEIADIKTLNAPAPEARAWKDIKMEYEALYHLERLYNGSTQLEQPDKCKFFDNADCCYPIEDCENCPNYRGE